MQYAWPKIFLITQQCFVEAIINTFFKIVDCFPVVLLCPFTTNEQKTAAFLNKDLSVDVAINKIFANITKISSTEY